MAWVMAALGASCMWHQYQEGQTIGTTGSENGTILLDEEHASGARISLEKGGWQPFSVTCGIYGAMVHTAFASTNEQASELFGVMKERIEALLQDTDEQSFHEGIEKFVQDF